jgi:hypothetical protein
VRRCIVHDDDAPLQYFACSLLAVNKMITHRTSAVEVEEAGADAGAALRVCADAVGLPGAEEGAGAVVGVAAQSGAGAEGAGAGAEVAVSAVDWFLSQSGSAFPLQPFMAACEGVQGEESQKRSASSGLRDQEVWATDSCLGRNQDQ